MAADMKKACKDAVNFCKKAKKEKRDDAKLLKEANGIISDTKTIKSKSYGVKKKSKSGLSNLVGSKNLAENFAKNQHVKVQLTRYLTCLIKSSYNLMHLEKQLTCIHLQG